MLSRSIFIRNMVSIPLKINHTWICLNIETLFFVTDESFSTYMKTQSHGSFSPLSPLGWMGYCHTAPGQFRQFHRSFNGVNPSSGFRDIHSTMSGPKWYQIWQGLVPWTSSYEANVWITNMHSAVLNLSLTWPPAPLPTHSKLTIPFSPNKNIILPI